MTKQEEKTIEDEREKNAARQKKYREKRKLEAEKEDEKPAGNLPDNVTNLPEKPKKDFTENDPWRSWKKLHILAESPVIFGLAALVFFLTGTLVLMQADVYVAMGHDYAFMLAFLTEILLVVLFVIKFRGVLWLVNGVMITLLIAYNLGLLGYGVYRETLAEIDSRVKDSLLVKTTGRSLDLVQSALAVATKKEESGNISRLSKLLKDLGADYNGHAEKAVNNMIEQFKMWALIALRLILMVSNGLLAGKLVGVIRQELALSKEVAVNPGVL